MDEVRPLDDSSGKRTDDDLDSISCGSDSKAKCKIYFNTRKDKPEDVDVRITWAVSCLTYMRDEMKKGGLV